MKKFVWLTIVVAAVAGGTLFFCRRPFAPTYGAHNDRAAANPLFVWNDNRIEYRAPRIEPICSTNLPPAISCLPVQSTNSFIEVAGIMLAVADRPVPHFVFVDPAGHPDGQSAMMKTDAGEMFALIASDEIPGEVTWTLLSGEELPKNDDYFWTIYYPPADQ